LEDVATDVDVLYPADRDLPVAPRDDPGCDIEGVVVEFVLEALVIHQLVGQRDDEPADDDEPDPRSAADRGRSDDDKHQNPRQSHDGFARAKRDR